MISDKKRNFYKGGGVAYALMRLCEILTRNFFFPQISKILILGGCVRVIEERKFKVNLVNFPMYFFFTAHNK